jgi:outer membrane protein OmpA-like peptidoglycan-associated protein
MKQLLLLMMGTLFLSAPAQDYLGFINSNYSGITGAMINPANIADNRMVVDVNLLGLNLTAANNYVGMKRSALAHKGSYFSAVGRLMKGDPEAFPAFNDKDFQSKYLVDTYNGQNKSIFVSARLSLPSFMVAINQKNSIGVTVNMRSVVNMDGLSEQLARLIYADFGRNVVVSQDKATEAIVRSLLGKTLQNDYFSTNAMLWMEYGLTYAVVLHEKNKHFFKAGITPKLLQGLASAYANVRDLYVKFDTSAQAIKEDKMAVFRTELSYGHSDNLEIPSPNAPDRKVNPNVDDPTLVNTFSGYPKFASYPGMGLDLGMVYEYRPKVEQHKYNMDGQTGLWRKDQNKYKLRVGLSILDIGSIKFRKAKFSQDVRIDREGIKYRQIKTGDYPVFDFDFLLDTMGTRLSNESTYKMSLPTSISAQIDYNIWKDFYINLTPFIGLEQRNRQAKVHDLSTISLSPRWDHKWFGVAVPFSYSFIYNKTNQPVKTGAMVRLGPLALGTNDVMSYFPGAGNIFGANFYFLLKVPIPYGYLKDSDHDAVSNKLDRCIDVPGVWEFKGCPDRDGDHIQDAEDLCPDIAGKSEMRGCPDKDSDGITDADDECPDSAGLAEFKGCPDRDKDGIIDRQDDCPDVAGLAEFRGCPDRDADGTEDREDVCPDVFGPKEYKGCPDKDGDKILDKEDECPDQAGPIENKGCPWPDTDKDGIFDKEDSCVAIPGIAQYKGCPPPPPAPPPMKAAEKKIIERAFANLEFATGKDIIKPKSFPSLNALATLLITHKTDWKLKLAGHTDNEGTEESNMLLSEKRSKAVKAYLVKRGVDEEQILTEWYGQTMPIADNKTPKGRQKNRRVEMKILSREE